MQEKAFFLNRESSTIFDKTTWKFPIYGFDVESSKMISQACDHSEIAKKAKEKYSKEVMAQGYINLYKSSYW